MFLANSLNEKLKRSFSEIEIEPGTNNEKDLEKKSGHLAVLTVHKHPDDEHTRLDVLNKKEWDKRFGLPRLRDKWNEKINTDFNPNHKKFHDDLMSTRAKEAKKYVLDLVDRDFLEVKKKRWNISVNAQDKIVPELKKTIFDVTQGLNDFQVVKLKDHKIPEGVDTREHSIIDGEKWNNSTFFEDWEKKKMNKNSIEKAQMNTMNYWNMTQFARINEEIMPISDERLKFEQSRYYKKYTNPIQNTKDRYELFRKVKELTWMEREKIEKNIIFKNPGNKQCSEKINSLVEKEMYNTYRSKYDEITGKSKTQASTKVDWKDEDISQRIKTLNDWRDVKWFRPMLTESDIVVESNKKKRKELLKPLVPQASIIKKEEESIKEKIFQNYKKKMKMEMLRKRNKAHSLDNDNVSNALAVSKYPIDQEDYDRCIKEYQTKQTLRESHSADTDLIIEDSSNIIPSQKRYHTHYFLEAYKKVALEVMNKDKIKMKKKRRDKCIYYQYSHPGTYREFEFKEKKFNDYSTEQFTSKTEKIQAWSCCMNTIADSKGCKQIVINKYKWDLSNA